MTSVAETVITDAANANPDVPALQAAAAAVATVEDPSPSNIISDIELAISLVKDLKAKLANSHPTVWTVIKAIL